MRRPGRADTFPMAIMASLFGATAALCAVHVVVSRLRWIEWDNRAAHSHPVLDARPPALHHPELSELARRVDPEYAEDGQAPDAAGLSPFAQAAGWRPRRHGHDRRHHVAAAGGR